MKEDISKKIPEEIYEQILENIPICCVDVIIHDNKRVLLVQRDEEPAKDEWWVIGGRILKGERFEDAVKRKIKEEVGLNGEIEKRIGTYELIFDKGNSNDARKGTHAVAVVYLAKLFEERKIELDETSRNYKWIGEIEESLHPYLKKVLKDSKVFD